MSDTNTKWEDDKLPIHSSCFRQLFYNLGKFIKEKDKTGEISIAVILDKLVELDKSDLDNPEELYRMVYVLKRFEKKNKYIVSSFCMYRVNSDYHFKINLLLFKNVILAFILIDEDVLFVKMDLAQVFSFSPLLFSDEGNRLVTYPANYIRLNLDLDEKLDFIKFINASKPKCDLQ